MVVVARESIEPPPLLPRCKKRPSRWTTQRHQIASVSRLHGTNRFLDERLSDKHQLASVGYFAEQGPACIQILFTKSLLVVTPRSLIWRTIRSGSPLPYLRHSDAQHPQHRYNPQAQYRKSLWDLLPPQWCKCRRVQPPSIPDS